MVQTIREWKDFIGVNVGGVDCRKLTDKNNVILWQIEDEKWYEIYDKVKLTMPKSNSYISMVLDVRRPSTGWDAVPMTRFEVTYQAGLNLKCGDGTTYVSAGQNTVSLSVKKDVTTYNVPYVLDNAHTYYINGNTGKIGCNTSGGSHYSKSYDPSSTSLSRVEYTYQGDGKPTEHTLHKMLSTVEDNGKLIDIELVPIIITEETEYEGTQFHVGDSILAAFNENDELMYFTSLVNHFGASFEFYNE